MKRIRYALNDGWTFYPHTEEGTEECPYPYPAETVRLPHTTKEVPLHYFDESLYQMECVYTKDVTLPTEAVGGRILLHVDGAAHTATVSVNGKQIGKPHRSGYTAFVLDLTDVWQSGTNTILIRVDSRENQNIPPFGNVVDYMTFGGLYREVWLEIVPEQWICDVFLQPRRIADGQYELTVETALSVTENAADYKVVHRIFREEDTESFELTDAKIQSADASQYTISQITQTLTGVQEWSIEAPTLYVCTTFLYQNDQVVDYTTETFGFREALFRADGFYLNDKKVKLRGLNRHQSYPYVGYAMPKRMQEMDAEILKSELSCNSVRTSHYPQSQHFIRRCDEIGLLVMTEIPGWQHIGDEKWKAQAVENVAEMVKQYRNHPSIVLWGVRINESPDDDAFYQKTNEVAKALDPTRMTGGVRCIKNSHLLEDVYTYNDFFHDGTGAGVEPKKNVTGDQSKGYLVTEYNGHMYPTKAYDSEVRRVEHMLRHARVLNDVAKEEDIAGSFGWCMFDYHTHKDFGSGDRICYHGVMDAFRNPKLAAAVYRAQEDAEPVLEISSDMDVGEHDECIRGEVYAITNADSVRVYREDEFLCELSETPFPHLKHGPILLSDFVGELIVQGEDFTPKQAQLVKDVLNATARYGMKRMPKKYWMKSAWLILRYHMNVSQAIALYNKYIGDWGGTSNGFMFVAIKDGKEVKRVEKKTMHTSKLQVTVSHQALVEGDTYDVAAVRMQLVSDYGNVLHFDQSPIRLETEGSIALVGPHLISLSGGMGGCYVKSKGKNGMGVLRILSEGAAPMEIAFEVEGAAEEAGLRERIKEKAGQWAKKVGGMLYYGTIQKNL